MLAPMTSPNAIAGALRSDAVTVGASSEGLGAADGFRFANRLRAWIDVEGGEIVDLGYAGGAVMGSTTVCLGKQATFQAVGLPELQRDPEVTPTSVRFVQTSGGRPAIPA